MNQYTIDTKVKNGNVTIENLPFEEGSNVTVIIVPKMKLKNMSFEIAQKLSKSIKGNISDNINSDRE